MPVTFTTRQQRIAARLAIIGAILAIYITACSAEAGPLAPAMQELINDDQDRSAEEWAHALARLCTAEIRVGNPVRTIVFEARPVTELLVHYERGFNGLNNFWADQVVFRNEDLNYLVIRIPDGSSRGFFQRVETDLARTSGVRVVEPRCLPKLRTVNDQSEENCVSPNMLAQAASLIEQTRVPEACASGTLGRSRVAIGLPQLLSGTLGKTTLVAVIDQAFEDIDKLGPALADASYDKDGTLFSQVNGWDYCKNNPEIDGDDSGVHGTQMGGLIAASCDTFGLAPGVAQSALIFAMRVFYENVVGAPEFVAPEALAEAIHDAQSMGARVINMSFTINPLTGAGWTAIETAMVSADNVVFVTGPHLDAQLPFPHHLESDNMILVGTRKWNAAGDKLTGHVWGSELHIDSPMEANLVVPPSSLGTSNAIALVSGAAAELLGRPNCDTLTPAEVREILVEKGKPSDDADEKPLVQVDSLEDCIDE